VINLDAVCAWIRKAPAEAMGSLLNALDVDAMGPVADRSM
jgi:hypothetical protein